MGDQRGVNGVVIEEAAEAAAGEIIRQVQPSVGSEETRRSVVNHVQRLFKGYLDCEVCPFGSVPLKTYLPDGDIDLTAFCNFNFEDTFANEVFSVLEAEDGNPAAKFVVKDVQYIHAEVKLVKCLVQNIVVDISFNQIGGLCTLCFLEEIDRLIGKDHLFKRSIILIKAWCYYESRILGAHHGLISTYALETMVLYIFHLFHSSLNGPLAVLHKFLDYFSKFDWENLCVSLSGPVHVASLSETVVEKPESSDGELLLSDDFMRECVRKFYVPSRGAEMNYKMFSPKHLNIVDPLKENNNLGRSVSKGNFFRIRSAFSYGARKLGQIFSQPQENIAEEVRKFFTNTLSRHGTGQRPDVQEHLQLLPFTEPYRDQIYTNDDVSAYSNNQSSESRVASEDIKHVIASDFRKPGTNVEGKLVERQTDGNKSSSGALSVVELSKELSASASLSGDANEPTTSDFGDEKMPPGGLRYAPHLYFRRPVENFKMGNGYLDENQYTESSLTCSVSSFNSTDTQLCDNNDQLSSMASNSHRSPVDTNSHSWQDPKSVNGNGRLVGSGRRDTAEHPPDLSGDVDCHLNNLHYGRWWYDHGWAIPIHTIPPSMFRPNGSWDAMHQTMQSRHELGPQLGVNGVVPRAIFIPKSRGLGTYFPDTNHQTYKDRSSPKGRYPGHLRSPRMNGRGATPLDRSQRAQAPLWQDIGRPKFSDNNGSTPRESIYKETNGFVEAPEKVFKHVPPLNSPPEEVLPEIETCTPPESDPSPESENVETILGVNDARFLQSYQLKDDEDFPPLCT
ncbi:hypothetical protein vseg_010857 [Gypsophila vaccaria]